MVDAREHRIAENSQLGLKDSFAQRLQFSPHSYFENNVRLSIMVQNLCVELHEASPDYQQNLQGRLFNGDFNLLQRHEMNLTRWFARLPAELQFECPCTIFDKHLMLDQRLNLHIRYCHVY